MSKNNGIFRSGSALCTLRDEVQYAFAKSGENIEAAAATLVDVAENYATVDDETRALAGGATGLAGSMYSFHLDENQLTAKNMREVAMPTPPGTDEIDTESFHHESSL